MCNFNVEGEALEWSTFYVQKDFLIKAIIAKSS